MNIDYKDIDARAKAISDAIPARIRAKAAYTQWLVVDHWRMGHPFESSVPSDPTKFSYEGITYNPQVDF